MCGVLASLACVVGLASVVMSALLGRNNTCMYKPTTDDLPVVHADKLPLPAAPHALAAEHPSAAKPSAELAADLSPPATPVTALAAVPEAQSAAGAVKPPGQGGVSQSAAAEQDSPAPTRGTGRGRGRGRGRGAFCQTHKLPCPCAANVPVLHASSNVGKCQYGCRYICCLCMPA